MTASGTDDGRPDSAATASCPLRALIVAMAAESIRFARVVGMQHHGGARLGERPLDALVGFLGERRIEHRQRRELRVI